jgi:hypothetical protein
MLSENHLSGFWRGYSSALSICPSRRRRRQLKYHGLTLGSTSSFEAIAKDWEMIGLYFSSALVEDKYEHKPESPVHAGR